MAAPIGAPPDITVLPKTEIAAHLASYIQSAVTSAVPGAFHVAVAGGSLLPTLAAALEWGLGAGFNFRLADWRIWFVDERLVPIEHVDSNYNAFMKAVYSKPWWPQHPEHVFAVKTDLLGDAAAAQYAERLHAALNCDRLAVPSVHLVLLGMGEDGHVASLFPGHPLLNAVDAPVLAIRDSPKPPAARITFSLTAISAAKQVCLVITGAGKAAAAATVVSQLRHGCSDATEVLPAARVRQAGHDMIHIVADTAAAEHFTT